MAPKGKITALEPYSVSVRARFGPTTRTTIAGAGPEAWFGPLEPISPIAPRGTGGRQFDYGFGANLNYTPRGGESVSFQMLRNLADALPELRIVIEKRKDQIAGRQWDVQKIVRKTGPGRRALVQPEDSRVDAIREFLRRPDRRLSFQTWLRALMEDMLVIDAATIYPRWKRSGDLYSLDLVDGSTIKPLIGADGRSPLPPDPAYQQILHGVPAADFAHDELLYLPRNVRTDKLYGFSPVEWIVLTVNIAIRRSVYNLNYYKEGNVPEGFGTLPKEWTQAQIQQFQDYFDSMLAGDLAERRRVRFMPEGFKFTDAKAPPLKDSYDEWLMRLIASAFSVAPNPWVNDNTRATSQTIQITSTQEGIVPLKNWLKEIMDRVVQELFGFHDLEFVWSGDDELDPLEKAQETQILVASGVKTLDEARADYGLDPYGIGPTVAVAPIPLLEFYNRALKDIENPDIPLPTAPKPKDGGAPPPREAPDDLDGKGRGKGADGRHARKGAPRTLYAKRRLINAADLAKWAKANGFASTVDPDDMHVTVAYSRAVLDWDSLPDANAAVVVQGGARSLEAFGEAIVLAFEAPQLEERWTQMIAAGASWDHPTYRPHVTLTYAGDGLDLAAIAPFPGMLVFGPEEFAAIDEDWRDGLTEKAAPVA